MEGGREEKKGKKGGIARERQGREGEGEGKRQEGGKGEKRK